MFSFVNIQLLSKFFYFILNIILKYANTQTYR